MKSFRELKSNKVLFSFYKNRKHYYQTCKKGELFLSFPKGFNDPFDGKPLIDKNEFAFEYCARKFNKATITNFFEKALGDTYLAKLHNFEKFKDYPQFESMDEFSFLLNYGITILIDEILEKYNDYVKELENICNSFGVACFSIIPPQQNMVLWAPYANNYKGFCVAYNLDFIYTDIGTEREDKIITYLCEHLYKVDYTDNFLFMDIKKLLDIPVSNLKENDYINQYIKKILTRKYKQWAYEEEYRLIINKNDEFLDKYFDKKGYGFSIPFPYFCSVCSFDVNYNPKRHTQVKVIAVKNNCFCYNLTLNNEQGKLTVDKNAFCKHNLNIALKKTKI